MDIQMITDYPKEQLSPPEIAKLLKISRNRVIDWISSGQLAAENVGSEVALRPRYKVAKADLITFVQARLANKAAQP